MKLKDFMSISGEHGLFKFIAQGRNAIIVEHLETGKRSTAQGSAKVSSLEDISIFTDSEDLPLTKVFDRIYEKENGGAAPDYKSDPEVLKKYFSEIVPDYDKERVYNSDIKKVILWYNTLHQHNLLLKDDPEQEAKEAIGEDKTEDNTPAPKAEKPAKAKVKPSEKKVRPAGKTESKSAATRSKGSPKAK